MSGWRLAVRENVIIGAHWHFRSGFWPTAANLDHAVAVVFFVIPTIMNSVRNDILTLGTTGRGLDSVASSCALGVMRLRRGGGGAEGRAWSGFQTGPAYQ